mmetsp:Transcript_76090/g.204170  ORF Transcript_76090/g.204170 Transcript_76090/m.204170 type:complete len:204 (-) Transcript_76090:475-1086(-)
MPAPCVRSMLASMWFEATSKQVRRSGWHGADGKCFQVPMAPWEILMKASSRVVLAMPQSRMWRASLFRTTSSKILARVAWLDAISNFWVHDRAYVVRTPCARPCANLDTAASKPGSHVMVRTKQPPNRAVSSLGLPMHRSWPSTKMPRRSHRPSASSMEWVVSSMARLLLASLMQAHRARRDEGSRPVLGSSCAAKRDHIAGG